MNTSTEGGSVQPKKAHCPKCGPERWCDILAAINRSGGDEDFEWMSTYYTLGCRGCEQVFFQIESTTSDDVEEFFNSNTRQWEVDCRRIISQYPPIGVRNDPDWIVNILAVSDDLYYIYRETISCVNYDLRVPSAISIRTCFDKASEIVGIDPGLSFDRKLTSLKDIGRISEQDCLVLRVLVDAGSAAAHRGWRPELAEITIMMDILDTFLRQLFVLGPKGRVLSKSFPERRKGAKP